MDIHRCRFVPYPPSAINSLAFSHTSQPGRQKGHPPDLRLAVGRANGDIEIWNPLNGAWHNEIMIRGGKGRSIEGIVWTQDPDEENFNGKIITGKLRLFSIGYSSVVTEWDMELGRPARHSSGNYGEVWCIAAQPALQTPPKKTIKHTKDGNFSGQSIIIGCADGAIVVLSTAEGDLKFQRSLQKPSFKRARILSLAFQNRNILIAGCADSTIRIFDVQKATLLRQMSLGAGPSAGISDILVWSVKCLPDGTIVSGDSAGEVRFWDGKLYTLSQRLSGHRADILHVDSNTDGDTIFSGGMDRKTTIYKRVRSNTTSGKRRWAVIAQRRFHSHDVKTMAAFESRNFSVIVSGGLDTNLVITPLRQFGLENHRTISSLAQSPHIGGSSSKRYLMSWWDREIRIWHVTNEARDSPDGNDGPSEEPKYRRLLARIELQGDECITSAKLSDNGEMLLVSSASQVKLFSLTPRVDVLTVRKADLPSWLAQHGARLVAFSPDCKWLVMVGMESSINLWRIPTSDNVTPVTKIFQRRIALKRRSRDSDISFGGLRHYCRVITRLAFSADSRILAVADLAGYVDSWTLSGHEDQTGKAESESSDRDSQISVISEDEEDNEGSQRHSRNTILGQSWISNPAGHLIPKLPSTPIVFSFRPYDDQGSESLINGHDATQGVRKVRASVESSRGKDLLFVVTADHDFYEFRLLKGSLSSWSRRNPTERLPTEFKGLKDRATGCIWDMSRPNERLWLYGVSWLWMFDLSKDFPISETLSVANGVPPINTPSNKKRMRNGNLKQGSGAGDTTTTSVRMPPFGLPKRPVEGGGEYIDQQQSKAGAGDSPLESDSEVYEGAENVGSTALVRLRNRLGENGTEPLAVDDEAYLGAQQSPVQNSGALAPAVEDHYHQPAWWCTYKYRPIMGMVPINGIDTGSVEGMGKVSNNMEVVLVERPMQDIVLPPRYYGDQEWDR